MHSPRLIIWTFKDLTIYLWAYLFSLFWGRAKIALDLVDAYLYAMIEFFLEDLKKESTGSQIEEGEEALGETNLNDTV